MHHLADFPHELLMAIDAWLASHVVVVEAGRAHLLFDVADGGFALGDAAFELFERGLARLGRALPLARRGVGALFVLVGIRRGFLCLDWLLGVGVRGLLGLRC